MLNLFNNLPKTSKLNWKTNKKFNNIKNSEKLFKQILKYLDLPQNYNKFDLLKNYDKLTLLRIYDELVKKTNKKTSKHFPSSTREWNNSIYVYNKTNEKLIPSVSEYSLKLIKSYFDLYNKRIESKMRTKRLLVRLRRLSSNKFYVSNGGFKHVNNKVLINLYVFNRQKNNYLLAIKKWFLKRLLVSKTKKQVLFPNKEYKTSTQKRTLKENQNNSKNVITFKLIKRVREINDIGIKVLRVLNTDHNLTEKVLDIVKKSNNLNIKNYKSFNKYAENFYKLLIKKSLKKIRTYFLYKQLVYLNKSKLNYTFLQYIKKHLENIFNKNVEFNIINLKKFYLNSDILSESMSNKLANNRRKMLKHFKLLKDKVNITKNKIATFDKPEYIVDTRLELSNDNLKLRKYIINNLKYKDVTGFRLEAKGRLSRRFTASRSVSKLKYKGNLLELDSSMKQWSSVLLKGNLRSNTQYTKIKSKTRIGSFGIKGWISGN